MNGKLIGYWLTTGLFSFALGSSGLMYLSGSEMIQEAMGHLGYPTSLIPLLGVAKVLGVVALLAPGFGKLKEWAYAGFVFNLIGAFWAHLSAGDGAESAPPLVLLAILIASYVLRPASRRPTIAAPANAV